MLVGWYALDVMRKQSRKRDWVALMIDVHPDEFKSDVSRTAREQWVPIPGKPYTGYNQNPVSRNGKTGLKSNPVLNPSS